MDKMCQKVHRAMLSRTFALDVFPVDLWQTQTFCTKITGLGTLEFKQYTSYRSDPKFSDRQAWANSADPDQTAPRGAI